MRPKYLESGIFKLDSNNVRNKNVYEFDYDVNYVDTPGDSIGNRTLLLHVNHNVVSHKSQTQTHLTHPGVSSEASPGGPAR